MKKIFIYALTLIALAACTAEDAVVEEVLEQPKDESSIMAVMEQPMLTGGALGSRASLHYDKFVNSNAALFEWSGNDHISVYKYGETDADFVQAIDFVQTDGQTNGTVASVFESASDGIKSLAGNTQYVAFFPQGTTEHAKPQGGYLIDVDYKDQVQASSIDMRYYFNQKTNSSQEYYLTEEMYENYLASEKAASAHLSKYDFLCSSPVTTRAMGGVHFLLNRMGAVVRFYVKSPVANMVYTELQLYNGSVEFALDATIDVSTKTMTYHNKSHVMKLKLGETGFDIGEYSDDNKFYSNETKKSYFAAYMMLAPIDLKPIAEQSTLYLIAHENGDASKIHYYKATLSAKPTLSANIFHQWTMTPGTDTPIEFTETTVEDWKQTEGYSNGEGGNGTSGW